MPNLNIEIKNIKGITRAIFEFPLENGIYALVGANGCGKSTLLQAVAQLIRPQNALFALRLNDFSENSEVNFTYGANSDKWYLGGEHGTHWRNQIYMTGRQKGQLNNIAVNGMYEGSLFVGTRFQDSKQVDNLISHGQITEDDLIKADDYVIKNMSYILHGDYTHYETLKRMTGKETRERFQLKNFPYFIASKHGGLISQYRMSSGECLLVSLLHFIYNAIIRSSLPPTLPILMLLDEIELALHPVAVSRFLDLTEKITREYNNVVVVLTTHAPEVIRKINPGNIYKLESECGNLNVVNPCYPSYAIRELYQHDKYDYLILCEDMLAKTLIERILARKDIRESKLICVLPVGGWESVLKLQREILTNNILGPGTRVISVLDGDIQGECGAKKEYSALKKMFLPIQSVEKFLYSVVYRGENKPLKKTIGDKYFQIKSLDTIISDFNKDHPSQPKQGNKIFYRRLIDDLQGRNISEESFVISLCDDIGKVINLEPFSNKLISELG